MVGTNVDRYELLKELGRGAMGIVYLARHNSTGREVALKLLHPDRATAGGAAAQEAVLRFQREGRAMGAVAKSENVVSILDAGIDPTTGSPFLVMELLDGEDLEALSTRLGPLPVDLALRVLAQALGGLIPAHKAGIVHRDLKPSNLFLMKRAEGGRTVKLLDFGIAKLREDAQAQGAAKLTAEGTAVGSPAYMSPEQVQAQKTLDVRSDVWSMGVVLYQLLSGKVPFAEAETMRDLLLAIVLSRPQPVTQRAPWVPASVQAIIERATQPDPAARFADAQEMREAVVRVLGAGRPAPDTSTAISDAMLEPLSPEARSSQLPVSAMVVSVPGSLPGSATAPMTAAPNATSATAASVSAGAAPGSATVPVSAAPAGMVAGTTAGVAASTGAATPPVAVAPPFAFPTQPSAGVVKPSQRGNTVFLVVAGLIVSGGIGAGAFAVISSGTNPSPPTTISQPAPPPAIDAGGGGPADAATPVVNEPTTGEPSRVPSTPALPPSDPAPAPPSAAGAKPNAGSAGPIAKPSGRLPHTQPPVKVKTID